jgi:ankyrin repeat protein
MVHLLLSKGAQVTSDPHLLQMAVNRGNTQIVSMLVSAGASLDQDFGDGTIIYGSLMMWLGQSGQDMIGCLYDCGYNFTRADMRYGNTPLHDLMLYRGNPAPLVTTLLGYTGRVALEKRNGIGHTPLLHACVQKSVEGALALLDAGSDLQATDNQGRSALHLAVIPGVNQGGDQLPISNQLIDTLISRGADIHCQDHLGFTPAMLKLKTDRPHLFPGYGE